MASRHRSGSSGAEFDPPPSSPPPPPPDEPEAVFPNFPPVYKGDSLPRTHSKPPTSSVQTSKPSGSVASMATVGSKVSRMKEIFQATNGGSAGHEEHKFQPMKTYHHHVARSPPPALMPRSPPPSNQSKPRHASLTRTKEPGSPTETASVSCLFLLHFVFLIIWKTLFSVKIQT